MTSRTSLLAVAALCTFAAAPAGAQQAGGADAARVARLQAEVEALRAQVAALSARLDAQQAAASAAPAPAPAAPAPQLASTAPAPARAPEASTAARQSTTVSGRMFFNVSHIEQKSDGATVGRSTAFDVKRLYLGVDHRFNDVWSANLTTDASLIANTGTVTGTANSATPQPGQGTTPPAAFPKTVGETVFIKKAYLQGRFDPALTVRLGAADLPWIPFAEEVYGYRWIEQVVTDRTGFGTSTDWGVHASGSLAKGLLNYAVSVVDGGGYRNPLRSRSVDVEGRVSLNYHGIVAAVGGYAGKRAADTFTPFSPVNNATTPVQTGTSVQTFHTANRFNALLAYTSDTLRFGAEYFWARNWNQVTRIPSDTSDGWSAFGAYRFDPRFSVFARYDRVKPTRDLFPAITDHYFNAGISYQPVKIVEFALVYKRDQVNHGYFAPGNANPSNFAFPIGGRDHGTADEFGLYGQFRF
jgi:outer membrane murein-binding lipoprotein Lpp